MIFFSQITNFNSTEIVVAILGAIATVSGGWWAWRKTKLISKETQQYKFYEQMLNECSALRLECGKLRIEIGRCQSKITSLESRLKFYEENHLAIEAREMLAYVANDIKHPFWIHNVGQNKWYVNDAYCKMFNISRSNFWTPINILARYEPSTALLHISNDLKVIKAGIPLEFIESACKDIMNPDCQDIFWAKYRKTPINIGKEEYVLGTLIEIVDPPTTLK